ncbi:TetR/AcrR family transcriptional regulator [Streptomyces liangshanensis]|uniref:TetR/AcrR family transcriptional regulator n=1 Tax=Streptomyces liangshanensis TaxID=2717324 RepID=A0A6G9GSQ0_9ACTN|nr:TetR/AcrR family transcriptional regulator [Streptomyces liangshanensis]QIQ01041.1 TetR/AcrR family transcriptional regulator [Streptomyces liangshanensis]
MKATSESARSGRPLGFDRSEALTRLMTLFWETGFERVTQQQMAAATGLSTSSLYNTFGTKAEIYREAMDDYLLRMRAVLEPLEDGVRGREDVLETLTRVADVLDSAYGRFGCMATTAMTAPADEYVVTATERYRERIRAAFRAVAERARDLGENVRDPVTTANLMTAALLGTLTVARAAPDSPELAAQLRALRDFVNGWRSP